MFRTCMLAIALSVFVLAPAGQARADTTEEFHKTLALAPGATVRVSNPSGKVDLASWDQSYADIRAVKHSRHGRADLGRASIEIKSANGSLDIQTVYDRSGNGSQRGGGFLSRLFGAGDFGSRPWVEYTIRVPRTAVLEWVKTSSGDIEVRDVRGNALLQASSGNVTVSGANGALDVRTSSGDIGASRCRPRYVHASSGDVRLRDVQGDFRLETSSGSEEIEGANGRIDTHSSSGDITVLEAKGTVSAESSSGDIRAENSALSNVHTTSGNITLRGVRGDMRLNTSSGTVQVSGTDGTVDAHSTSGNIWM
jgi:hypothetical protein